MITGTDRWTIIIHGREKRLKCSRQKPSGRLIKKLKAETITTADIVREDR